MSHSLRTDLVLVNPGARTEIYQSLGKRLTAVENPMWAGLIATFVRRRGYSVEIVDAEADELAPSQMADRIADIKPRLVAIVVYGHQPSASTQNMTGASRRAAAIRDRVPDARILMLGGHVAALPSARSPKKRATSSRTTKACTRSSTCSRRIGKAIDR